MGFIPTEEHDKARPPEKSIDYDELDKTLAQNVESRLREWFADKQIKEQGQWFKIGNKGSLTVNAYDGHWTSFEDDSKGKGLLSLYARRYGIELEEAANDLHDSANLVSFRKPVATKSAQVKEPPQWEHCTLPPDSIPTEHWELGKADHIAKYSDRDGNPIGLVLRWDQSDERPCKDIRPISWVQMIGKESPEWKWCHFAEPRPLYRGERINAEPRKPILIVEGEKTVEAAEKLLPDYVVISWPQGTSGVNKCDWSGLEDRDVTIWADADEPGAQAAQKIIKHIPHAELVDVSSFDDKWDLADAAQEGKTGDWIRTQIEDSKNRLFVDLASILDSDMEPERPTIAASDSGDCLLYAGRINEIHGEPSVGKTNINIAIMACELRMGRKVMFIDPEDNPHGIMRRMLAFGVSKEMILANLYYLHDPTPEDLIAAHRWADKNNPAIVALDGVAEMITGCKYKEDSSSDVLEFFKLYIRPFTHCGAAVNLSDHVVKTSEGRGLWSRGSGAKMGRYDGVSYHVTLAEPYSPTQKGAVKFTIAKDRNGGIGAKGDDVFMAFFEPNQSGMTDISIRRLKPDDGIEDWKWKQLEAMHATIKATDNQGVSATSLTKECNFSVEIPKNDRVKVRDMLVKMGLIEERKHGKEKQYHATNKEFPAYKKDS